MAVTKQRVRKGRAGGGIDTDARSLRRAVSGLSRAVMFRDRSRICCYDVSVTQSYALDAVLRNGRMTQRELAAEMSLDKSTTSRLVGALERKGYVRRSPKRGDGRAVELSATRKGRALSKRMALDDEREMRRLMRDLPPASRRDAARLIARIAHLVSDRYS